MKVNLLANYSMNSQSNKPHYSSINKERTIKLDQNDKVSFSGVVMNAERAKVLEDLLKSAIESFDIVARHVEVKPSVEEAIVKEPTLDGYLKRRAPSSRTEQFVEEVRQLQETHLNEQFDGLTRLMKHVFKYLMPEVTPESIACTTFKRGKDILTNVTGEIVTNRFILWQKIWGPKRDFGILMELKNGNVVR